MIRGHKISINTDFAFDAQWRDQGYYSSVNFGGSFNFSMPHTFAINIVHLSINAAQCLCVNFADQNKPKLYASSRHYLPCCFSRPNIKPYRHAHTDLINSDCLINLLLGFTKYILYVDLRWVSYGVAQN